MFSKKEFYDKKLQHDEKVKTQWIKGIQKKLNPNYLRKALRKAQAKAIKAHTEVISAELLLFPTGSNLPAQFVTEVEAFTDNHLTEVVGTILKGTEWERDAIEVRNVVHPSGILSAYMEVCVVLTPATTAQNSTLCIV